ncbi:MAG: lipoyl(octanoyl) transferase LipB, partial [Aquabacterium sp.]|nr:lipoyl(octanoyl) transferase LipB [Aquabacterium sp.]
MGRSRPGRSPAGAGADGTGGQVARSAVSARGRGLTGLWCTNAPVSTIIQNLGLVPYAPTMAAMQAFTDTRTNDTPDEIWVCQHPPTFTQGLAGKADHVLFNPEGPDHIPVVQTNRGGQVTYHGPGQVVAYPLLNLQRRGYFVKEYVYRLEEAIIRTLAHFGVTGHRVAGAPGIYVRLDDPFAHAALSTPADPRDPFKGLGKIAAL